MFVLIINPLIRKNIYQSFIKVNVIKNFRNYNSLKNFYYLKINKNASILNKRNSLINYQNKLLLSSDKQSFGFTWKSFIISAVFLGIFGSAMLYLKNEKFKQMERKRKTAIGETAIGGKFTLIDQNGNEFKSTDLEGKWALIYFGFTHCPDVCPDELEKIAKAVELISANKKADLIQPVFITVDPERDSVAAVREYIREFSPKFIGLTGTKEQIEIATKAYRVYYSSGPRDAVNDYIVDHTIITYLIDPEGNLVDYYGQTKTAEDVKEGVIKAMINYKKLNRNAGFF